MSMRPKTRGPRVPHDPPLHLRAELLRREQHQPEVAAALREVEQHLADVGIGTIGRRVLVELVHEHDDVVHPEVAALEMLAQLGDHAGEDQILRQGVEAGDVHHVHAPVGELPQGRSLAAPSSVTRPLDRVEMLLSRLRIFRMVARWCVFHTSPPLPSASMKSKMARKNSSRSAKLCTWNGRPRSMSS